MKSILKKNQNYIQNFEIPNFHFPRTCSWAFVRHCGHDWTCGNVPARLPLPRFLACITLSRQSTGTARNFKIRKIWESSKTRNPQNLGISKSANSKISRRCLVTSTQHFQTLFTPRPHSQPTARDAEAPTCPCGAGSSTVMYGPLEHCTIAIIASRDYKNRSGPTEQL